MATFTNENAIYNRSNLREQAAAPDGSLVRRRAVVKKKVKEYSIKILTFIFLTIPGRLLQCLLNLLVEIIKAIFFRVRIILVNVLSWGGALYLGAFIFQRYGFNFYLIPVFFASQIMFKSLLTALLFWEKGI